MDSGRVVKKIRFLFICLKAGTGMCGERISRTLTFANWQSKTIMTGLLIKEEIVRGDLQRCMIVCPGNLAEQWQDELDRRFHLPFDIIAYTVNYDLSGAETQLYERVTAYVREEFNRAEALESEGRKGTVGFALTVLQRRLASSPEAIYQSLRRRKERLEKRLREEEILRRGAEARLAPNAGLPVYTLDDLDDLDDAPDAEVEEAEEQVVDQASAARTIKELQIEIGMLKDLEKLAYRVRQSGADRKWDELSRLLQNNSEMFDTEGHRRKLVVFSEHRDTLNYLNERTSGLLGRPEAIVTIHGGMGREERRKAQNAFTQDKEVEILIATDAASEGINLQRAHLMVNYDLPWNPNRLEQRFGRIHRIGQTEVCHLWNLVAKGTRQDSRPGAQTL